MFKSYDDEYLLFYVGFNYAHDNCVHFITYCLKKYKPKLILQQLIKVSTFMIFSKIQHTNKDNIIFFVFVKLRFRLISTNDYINSYLRDFPKMYLKTARTGVPHSLEQG